MKSYTPQELDIPFPEITGINIGECPGEGTHFECIASFNAHTHLCKKDKFYKNICIPDKKYLFNSDSSISDILWHEYAHVLDANYLGALVTNCDVKGNHAFEFSSTKEMKNNWEPSGHGPTWKKIMKRFGKSPDRFVSEPY